MGSNSGQDCAYFLVNAVRYHELVKAFDELNSRGSMRGEEKQSETADQDGAGVPEDCEILPDAPGR